MKRVAVIGGGVSGLSATFYLERMRRGGAPLEYVLFESSARLGGVIKTERIDEFVIEAGADSFLTSKPWASDLARDAGLADQLLPSNDRKRKTYILDHGTLIPIPDGMQMMVPTAFWPIVGTPLISWPTKLRMLGEYLSPPTPLDAAADESVASFVSRHFGEEIVAKLAAPMLAGIYGGDANLLSARSALPSLVAMETKHHSLVRGTMDAMARQDSQPRRSLFTSFRNGMQQFVDAIVAGIDPAAVHLNANVSTLERNGPAWTIDTKGKTGSFDQVILGLPSYAAAKLVPFDAGLAAALSGIRYHDSITVALAYSCEKLRRCAALPPGFGFLVPAGEKRSIIACTFVHNKFDSRVGDDFVLLRVFLTGGIDKSDTALIATVESELATILNIKAPTELARVYRWPQAMPQYEVGHLQKVEKISAALDAHSGLQLIGNAYRGLGIPDCVREGKSAAEKAAGS